ncbi:MAG: NACHT domain-containing protein [Cyanothece sp. SIO1E1]|nr:NACHT domain-containing protein [Cyanothece sp. SIO1E1]
MVWSEYLTSVCREYAQWWQVYTFTDVVGCQQDEPESSIPLLDLGLMVQTVGRQQDEGDKERDRAEEKEKIERLGVLEGLQKYAAEHVLLVGRPGSGKSTALARLLLEAAQQAQSEPQAGIPVLVELRYYQTSILDLMRDFLKRHRVLLSVSELEELLFQGKFLLLVDGLNELPSEAARRNMMAFRQAYPATPMVFTTRDLGVGGDLDIAKKLEMQPLKEVQMQQFVRAYLPEQGEQMLRQLDRRLREFGQTPLLLWMLCSLFKSVGQVPPNLGLVFRRFTQSYDQKLKQAMPANRESRRWWPRLLQHLAWVMIQAYIQQVAQHRK